MNTDWKPASSPPPRKAGWDHSENVLVYYPALPEAQLTDKFSVAYYHYTLPEGPKWVDFNNANREPSRWWILPVEPTPPADCCADWTPQSRKIDSYIHLQSWRAGRDLYDGIPFRFCPWCGKQRPSK